MHVDASHVGNRRPVPRRSHSHLMPAGSTNRVDPFQQTRARHDEIAEVGIERVCVSFECGQRDRLLSLGGLGSDHHRLINSQPRRDLACGNTAHHACLREPPSLRFRRPTNTQCRSPERFGLPPTHGLIGANVHGNVDASHFVSMARGCDGVFDRGESDASTCIVGPIATAGKPLSGPVQPGPGPRVRRTAGRRRRRR
jgi:hypothetical protein